MANGSRTVILVAANLRRAIVAEGMTQEELARQIGVSLRQVQKYCAGKADPSGARLIAMADVLGRPAGWFYTDHDAEKSAA